MDFSIKEIKVGESTITSVCEFNNGTSNVCIDGDCWVVAMGIAKKQFVTHLVGAAMEVLKKLPTTPATYKPYQKYLKTKTPTLLSMDPIKGRPQKL
jgi:hypothetical protein